MFVISNNMEKNIPSLTEAVLEACWKNHTSDQAGTFVVIPTIKYHYTLILKSEAESQEHTFLDPKNFDLANITNLEIEGWLLSDDAPEPVLKLKEWIESADTALIQFILNQNFPFGEILTTWFNLHKIAD